MDLNTSFSSPQKALSEVDLFKHILSQRRNVKIMEKILKLEFASKRDKIKHFVKLFFKVWNGFTKFLKKGVESDKAVGFSVFGYFYRKWNGKETLVAFQPAGKFVEEGEFEYREGRGN